MGAWGLEVGSISKLYHLQNQLNIDFEGSPESEVESILAVIQKIEDLAWETMRTDLEKLGIGRSLCHWYYRSLTPLTQRMSDRVSDPTLLSESQG
jgi:hypothetical protein